MRTRKIMTMLKVQCSLKNHDFIRHVLRLVTNVILALSVVPYVMVMEKQSFAWLDFAGVKANMQVHVHISTIFCLIFTLHNMQGK